MPAAIIFGMAAITCAKNEFKEFNAGLSTDVELTCAIMDAIVRKLKSKVEENSTT
jgi:hypothetical protein